MRLIRQQMEAVAEQVPCSSRAEGATAARHAGYNAACNHTKRPEVKAQHASPSRRKRQRERDAPNLGSGLRHLGTH